MNRVTEDILVGWTIVLMVPLLLCLGAIIAIWMLFLSPFIVGGLIFYWVVRRKMKGASK
jgi:hypothetical protein